MMLDLASMIPDEAPPEFNDVYLFLLKKVKADVDELLLELNAAINHRANNGPQWSDFYHSISFIPCVYVNKLLVQKLFIFN